MVAKRAIAGAVPAGAGKRGYDAAGQHLPAASATKAICASTPQSGRGACVLSIKGLPQIDPHRSQRWRAAPYSRLIGEAMNRQAGDTPCRQATHPQRRRMRPAARDRKALQRRGNSLSLILRTQVEAERLQGGLGSEATGSGLRDHGCSRVGLRRFPYSDDPASGLCDISANTTGGLAGIAPSLRKDGSSASSSRRIRIADFVEQAAVPTSRGIREGRAPNSGPVTQRHWRLPQPRRHERPPEEAVAASCGDASLGAFRLQTPFTRRHDTPSERRHDVPGMLLASKFRMRVCDISGARRCFRGTACRKPMPQNRPHSAGVGPSAENMDYDK